MALLLDRNWLITSTTYGTWLPGDDRGFVGPVDSERDYEIHNIPTTPYSSSNERLANWCATQLKCPPIYLSRDQAGCLLTQLLETCGFRRWRLLCSAVMANHFHALLTVPGDPEPEKLLNDLKAYASRALNRGWGKTASDTWWTQSGSKRKKRTERDIIAAVRYVWNQKGSLARYVDPEVPQAWLRPKAQAASGARKGRG